MDYIILGITAFVVAIVSSIAGGGGGLVITPLGLLLGFDPAVLLASGKGGGLGISIGSLSKFARQKGIIDWRWAGSLSALAIVASIIGTQIVFILDSDTLRYLVGLTTLALVPIFFFTRKIGMEKEEVGNFKKTVGVVLYFLVMTIQAGLGSGTGSVLMFVLMGLMGFDALGANATKRVAGLVLVMVSFIIFAISGLMDWFLVLALGAGTMFGGYIGAHLAVKHGNVLVKRALLVVAVVMALAVLFD